MTILKLWFSAIATTFANFGALLVFAIIYAFLLAASYLFIWIREATVVQVFATYALMILIPICFFTLQSSIINRALDQRLRWRVILIDVLKFLLVFIPVLLFVWLLYYLLNKLSARWPAPLVVATPVEHAAPAVAVPPVGQAAPVTTAPLHWPSLIFSTLRFVLWGVALPLASIHLWIAVAGGGFRALFATGVKSFLKRIGSALARAFSSDSVLIYGLGLIVFFVLPYVILVPTFNIGGNKTEFAVFSLRLLLSFLLSLIGWVATLNALARTVPALPVEVSASTVALPTESAA